MADRIKSNLNLIDQQLHPAKYISQFFYRCPLLPIAISLAIGIILQYYFSIHIAAWLSVTVISIALLITFLKSSNNNLITIALILCCISTGAIRLIHHQTPSAHDIRNIIKTDSTPTLIHGQIISPPVINRYENWKMARFCFFENPTGFYLKLSKIEINDKLIPATGKIKLYINEPVLDLKQGQTIQAYCKLTKFRKPNNPAQFNTKQYFENKGVFFSASVRDRQAIKILNYTNIHWFSQLKQNLANKANQILLGNSESQDDSDALLAALVLGTRTNITSKTIKAFQNTGLLHFISLSGLHLAILLGFIWVLLKPLSSKIELKATISLFALILFLLIVPPRSATIRAGIIAFFIYLSIILHKKTSIFNSLSLAAIVILLFKPMDIFNISFQLSFACVIGIVIFQQRIQYFTEQLPLIQSLLKSSKKTTHNSTRIIISLLASSAAALLGGAGIIVYNFYMINPMTILWTAILFPLIGLTLILSMTKIFLTALFPTIATILTTLLKSLTATTISIVEFINQNCFGKIITGKIPLAIIISYYIILLLIATRPIWDKYKKTIYASISALIILSSIILYSQKTNPGIKLSILSIGSGQTIMLQTNTGQNIMFDCGSISIKDIGNKIVLPFCNYKAITHFDNVFISHSDKDHFNALPEIIDNISVKSVELNADFKHSQSSDALFIKEYLQNKNIPSQPTLLDIKITQLWPIGELPEKISNNNASRVSLIEYADKKILICSDIESKSQKQLIKMYPDLKADIIILPHHGSTNTIYKNFIAEIAPTIAIASCSPSQFKRYSKEYLYKNILYTAQAGYIEIKISSKGKIDVSQFLTR